MGVLDDAFSDSDLESGQLACRCTADPATPLCAANGRRMCRIARSWSIDNPGRVYIACHEHKEGSLDGCGLFIWLDRWPHAGKFESQVRAGLCSLVDLSSDRAMEHQADGDWAITAGTIDSALDAAATANETTIPSSVEGWVTNDVVKAVVGRFPSELTNPKHVSIAFVVFETITLYLAAMLKRHVERLRFTPGGDAAVRKFNQMRKDLAGPAGQAVAIETFGLRFPPASETSPLDARPDPTEHRVRNIVRGSLIPPHKRPRPHTFQPTSAHDDEWDEPDTDEDDWLRVAGVGGGL
ncbi:hypothetical protein JCM10212_002521 [Sporobolomyces blumeae]